MREGINVVSLFGGIECGRMALKKRGQKVAKYFSSEFDQYPMECSAYNFSDIYHIGDVSKVSYKEKTGAFHFGEYGYEFMGTVDLLIGGPPCTDLSIAGKRAGLSGEKSGLFYEYVRILRETNPRFFLLENVASMPKEAREEMTRQLGFDGVQIDSNLVSGQNRRRLYWVGKRNEDGSYSRLEITQPEDRGIKLRDILEDIPFSDPSWKPLREEFIEKVREKEKAYAVSATYQKAGPGCHISRKRTIIVGEDVLGIYQLPRGKNEGGIVCDGEKSPTLDSSEFHHKNILTGRFRGTDIRIHADQEKSQALTSQMGTGGNNVPVIMGMAHRNRGKGKEPEFNGQEKSKSLTTVQSDYEVAVGTPVYLWRKLTVRECARLQTIPDDYHFPVSDSRAYKGIGNGWTVDVIAHIFSFMEF